MISFSAIEWHENNEIIYRSQLEHVNEYYVKLWKNSSL